ncbi:alpha/beta fold hydrolase [Robbsia sp. Bb-Pol-6]|uniref:Alpha/beta fold hydrolase n=1 Tax=Robbsia betulipollinis TaxID=2981849 RepID=A0ABT3ZT20_9BURK|nr:alpha/beta fold hydrolase [Robbsia betulipollinis]MCY0389417.1 alpha/beta fold hydrolase [Robbsia betulipollinis]
MRPIVFNECFGWLHDAEGKTGVILCNPYGHEALWTHRGWRALAENLSRNHFPTLRFDYRGTGDSAGAENEGDAIETWLNSIEDAVRYMREHTGVAQVVLCGIRLGGTLAALVANRIAVDGLVMMAPVTSGREYQRELRLIQRRWRNTAAPHIEAEKHKPDYLETLGFRLYPETLRHLEQVALPQDLQPAVPNVLLLDPEKSRASGAVLNFYREHAVNVEVDAFDDYTALLSEISDTPAPHASIQRVVTWLRTHLGDGMGVRSPSDLPTAAVINDATAPDVMHVAPMLHGNGFCETPVIFDNGRLFGIYCRPETAQTDGPVPDDESVDDLLRDMQVDLTSAATGQYAVLFANTAASHHIGEARMWVTQARLLAQRGIASLRMDVGILGDSAGAQESIEATMLHSMRSCADVSEGISWLVDAGHTRPSPVGICSGAYLCFHATVMNPRAVGAVLINQNFYTWSDKDATRPEMVVAATRVYLASIRRADKWKRLFSGQIPVGTIAATLMRRQFEKWGRRGADILKAFGGQENHTGAVRKAFSTLAQRGVRVRILYGDFDVGLEESESYFGRDFKWLRGLPGMNISTERSLDHALFLYPARQIMQEVIERHLHEQASCSANLQAGGAANASRPQWNAFGRQPPLRSVAAKR